ncbi:Variant Ionotropic Glutamate Receptor [Penaeus vannamei]|uniref:Variant Ionotropic Glutamate Receptor n=1 Tax=Penaeus vannamei TaxID=6689 RepID=A0A3R7QCT1_PENVA|nr:Variant Ionotropic Glutamate Receptor [Penaeus vannamei]
MHVYDVIAVNAYNGESTFCLPTLLTNHMFERQSGTFYEVLQAGRRGRIKYLRSTEIPAAVDSWVRNRKDVLLIEDLTARIYMGQDVTDTGRCDFYTSRDEFLPLIFAMIGQKNSPLIPVISDKITRLTEGGVYEHWVKMSIPNSTVCAHASSKITVNTSLTLANLWGVFAVLGSGLTVALIVLLLEVCLSLTFRRNETSSSQEI